MDKLMTSRRIHCTWITGYATRAMLAGLMLWGGLMTGSVEAVITGCHDPCGNNPDPSFMGQESLEPIPISSGPSYPVPSAEYISRWFDVGRPDTVVVSWNTPLNPAVAIGSEPVIPSEPAGPNDVPIAVTLSETEITSDFLGAINLHVAGVSGHSVAPLYLVDRTTFYQRWGNGWLWLLLLGWGAPGIKWGHSKFRISTVD